MDIDFELMIEENKFKDKLLSPHTPSDKLKVVVGIKVVSGLCEEETYIQKGGAKWRNRLYFMR